MKRHSKKLRALLIVTGLAALYLTACSKPLAVGGNGVGGGRGIGGGNSLITCSSASAGILPISSDSANPLSVANIRFTSNVAGAMVSNILVNNAALGRSVGRTCRGINDTNFGSFPVSLTSTAIKTVSWTLTDPANPAATVACNASVSQQGGTPPVLFATNSDGSAANGTSASISGCAGAMNNSGEDGPMIEVATAQVGAYVSFQFRIHDPTNNPANPSPLLAGFDLGDGRLPQIFMAKANATVILSGVYGAVGRYAARFSVVNREGLRSMVVVIVQNNVASTAPGIPPSPAIALPPGAVIHLQGLSSGGMQQTFPSISGFKPRMPGDIAVVGKDSGDSEVWAWHIPTATKVLKLDPYGTNTFDNRPVVGDFLGTGEPVIAVASGDGTGGKIRFYGGKDGRYISQIVPYDATYTGGLFPATIGDPNNIRDQIAVGSGTNGRIRIFNLNTDSLGAIIATQDGTQIIPTSGATDGLRLASGRGEVASVRTAGEPKAYVFNDGLQSGNSVSVADMGNKGAYVSLSYNPLDLSAPSLLVLGTGDGNAAALTKRVRVYDRATGNALSQFTPYDGFNGGIKVQAINLNGEPCILVSPGPGSMPGNAHIPIKVFTLSGVEKVNMRFIPWTASNGTAFTHGVASGGTAY